jgi:transcriptional regulator with XRE-family HTH domain
MDQSATNQFRVALLFLLEKEGRGTQTRLAEKQKIDQGYLNAIVKGRKPGSEMMRGKIAAYFEIDYENMLSLGRRILAGEDNPDQDFETHESNSDIPDGGELEREQRQNHVFDISPNKGKGTGNILEKLVSVLEVLEVDTKYSNLLIELIDVFHDSVKTSKENLKLKKEMLEFKEENYKLKKQMEGLESRLAHLESCSKDEKKASAKQPEIIAKI